MDFSKEQIEKINSYIGNEKFKELCTQLNIGAKNDTQEQLLNNIKKYIEKDMLGEIRGTFTIEKFLKAVQAYLDKGEFPRDEEGYINYKLVLPIGNKPIRKGLRVANDILGQDRKQYIVKMAEGFKGPVSGFENSKDAKYNPTIAYALFKFLNQPCARNLMSYETFPYYYIFSENFIKQNEKMYGLNDEEFVQTQLSVDEENNITHKQIMDGIEETVNKKQLSPERKLALIKKLKLQYAVQETLKSLICSMDQNLGNTALVVKEENGEIEDINISPAYDLDLSFALGEEMLTGIPETRVLYRTTQEGKNDLVSIMNEFKSIEGYKEALEKIKNKLKDNYIDKIFDIAYEEAKVNALNSKKLRDRYGNFIMRRVAIFKEACKENIEIDAKAKN